MTIAYPNKSVEENVKQGKTKFIDVTNKTETLFNVIEAIVLSSNQLNWKLSQQMYNNELPKNQSINIKRS